MNDKIHCHRNVDICKCIRIPQECGRINGKNNFTEIWISVITTGIRKCGYLVRTTSQKICIYVNGKIHYHRNVDIWMVKTTSHKICTSVIGKNNSREMWSSVNGKIHYHRNVDIWMVKTTSHKICTSMIGKNNFTQKYGYL